MGRRRSLGWPPIIIAIGCLLVLIGGTTRLLTYNSGLASWPDWNGRFGEDIPHVAVGETMSFGSLMICTLNTKRPVRVIRAEPIGARGGLVATAVATRPNPFLTHPPGTALGAENKPLDRVGFSVQRPPLVTPCGPPSHDTEGQPLARTELGVSFKRTGTGVASETSLAVIYLDTDGQHRSTILPFELQLCPAACPDAMG